MSDVQQGGNALQLLRAIAHGTCEQDLVGTSLLEGPDPVEHVLVHEALLGDSIGLALLAVLETLTPAERVAFVLHDVFAVPFDEIAPIVGRSSAAARQLASRARRRVRGAPVPDTDLDG